MKENLKIMAPSVLRILYCLYYYPSITSVKPSANGRNINCSRTTPNNSQHCWELLRPFARSLKVWPVSNFNWATTGNRMCKRTQHVTSNNVGSCWPTICVRLLGAYVFSFRRQNENGLKLRKLGHVTSSVSDKIGPLWPKTDYALFSLWQNHPIPFT